MFERSIEAPAGQAAVRDASIRQRLDALVATPPGPDVLSALYAIDRGTLTQAEQLAWFEAFERVNGWMFAQRLTVMAEIAGPEPHSSSVPDGLGPQESDWIREELAALLRLAPSMTAKWLELARKAASWLRPTRDALNSARIGIAHFYALANSCNDLPEHTARVVQRELLAGAADQSLPAFKRKLRKAVVTADPRDAGERHEDTIQERNVRIYPDGEGTAAVLAEHLPAHEAEAIFNIIDARVRLIDSEDPRTVDQQRADEFVQVFRAAHADPQLPTEHRRRPDVQLIVDLPTVLGLADHPGELVGYGPIPPGLARQIAYDGKWRRLITDPMTGALLDYGRITYEPPQDLTDFVLARDRRCRFPGCSRKARRCELDHNTPFEQGGSTCPENLCALCKRHHDLKHKAGWSYELDDGGGVSWISPVGRTYYAPPPLLE